MLSFCVPWRLKSIIDLGASDGNLAIHCAKHRIPYLGFTLTEGHTAALQERCLKELLQSMLHEGDPLYNPDLALLLKKEDKGATNLKKEKGQGGTKASKAEKDQKGKTATGSGGSAGGPEVLDRFKQQLDAIKAQREVGKGSGEAAEAGKSMPQ